MASDNGSSEIDFHQELNTALLLTLTPAEHRHNIPGNVLTPGKDDGIMTAGAGGCTG